MARSRVFLFAVLFTIATATAAQAATACVTVNFFDRSGKPVKAKPAIAAVISGQLYLQSKGPANTTFQPGAPIVCPPGVVSEVSATYKKSCMTAAERDKTARANSTPRATVDQNCAGLQAFLSPVHN